MIRARKLTITLAWFKQLFTQEYLPARKIIHNPLPGDAHLISVKVKPENQTVEFIFLTEEGTLVSEGSDLHELLEPELIEYQEIPYIKEA